LRAVTFGLATQARPNQESGSADATSELNVFAVVAYDETHGRTYGKLPGELSEKAWLGLSAPTPFIGPMRTEKDRVDRCVFGFQLVEHPPMDSRETFFIEPPPAYD
jgi:hypothetical protein